jgi:uncharacterized phage-associated protein
VYSAYKKYRWRPIDESVEQPQMHRDSLEVINEVLQVYGGDTGFQLELRTHSETPWLEARGALAADEESTAMITHDAMMTYFKALADA